MQTSFIGVDVSKSELVISVDDLPPLSVVNDVAHITRWLAQLPRDCCIAMESTGRYHLLLAQLALQGAWYRGAINARPALIYLVLFAQAHQHGLVQPLPHHCRVPIT